MKEKEEIVQKKIQSISQSFICSEQYKEQVNAQYSIEQDTKA